MMGQQQQRAGVVLLGNQLETWLEAIVSSLAIAGLVPVPVLAASGLNITIRKLEGEFVEIRFNPADHSILVQMVTYDHGEGYLMLVASVPWHDDEPLCTTYVPRDRWQTLAEVAATN